MQTQNIETNIENAANELHQQDLHDDQHDQERAHVAEADHDADMKARVERIVDSVETVREHWKEMASPKRVVQGALFVAHSALERALDYVDKRIEVRTGQVDGPGTLHCTRCDTTMSLHEDSKVPPCPSCHGTNFIAGY